MCRVAYTPAAVPNKPKIKGVAASGEAPPTGGRVEWRQETSGDNYTNDGEVGTKLWGEYRCARILVPL